MKETEKHAQIINAAAQLFARYGYKKTSVDDIVAAAGISKGLFYHYYSGKKALFLHIYEMYTAELSRSVAGEVDTGNPDFFDRLKQIAHIRADFVSRYPDLWRFLYMAYEERHPDVEPEIRQKNRMLVQRSHLGSAACIDWAGLREGFTPEEAIRLVTWIAEGYVREVNREGLRVDGAAYGEMDRYIDALKTGLWKKED